MSAPETVADVTAEMRRVMPNACSDWADRIDRASRPSADTLRDWFAGQMIPQIVLADLTSGTSAAGPEQCAEAAYVMADAMLAARTPTTIGAVVSEEGKSA